MDNIIWQGNHWNLLHMSEYTLPGYLILTARDETIMHFSQLTSEQSSEMGQGLSLACSSIENCMAPINVMSGRYGLIPGHQLHYHIVPLYQWVLDAFKDCSEYSAFDDITPKDYPAKPDGAALLAFIWRELCFKKKVYVDSNAADVKQLLLKEISRLDVGK